MAWGGANCSPALDETILLVMAFASARVQKAVEHNVKRIPIARIILVLKPTMIIAGKIV
jgi:hypothetical protein